MAQALVIEDDPASAALAAATLESFGLRVAIATNGDDGLAMVRDTDFDLILLDIRMPGYNGYEVCRMLRDMNVATPIMVLSAKTGEYDEVEALELGADDYLRKPYSVAVLAARAQALLRRNRSHADPMSYAGISYNPTTREASVNEVVVHLTPREGQVMECLLQARAVPVARAVLLHDVWGEDFNGSPNVVDVYLRYLRQKVGAARIQTLPRVGYRLQKVDTPV